MIKNSLIKFKIQFEIKGFSNAKKVYKPARARYKTLKN